MTNLTSSQEALLEELVAMREALTTEVGEVEALTQSKREAARLAIDDKIYGCHLAGIPKSTIARVGLGSSDRPRVHHVIRLREALANPASVEPAGESPSVLEVEKLPRFSFGEPFEDFGVVWLPILVDGELFEPFAASTFGDKPLITAPQAASYPELAEWLAADEAIEAAKAAIKTE